MYATVYRMQVKPQQEDRLLELSRRWQKEFQPEATGFIDEYVIHSTNNPGEYLGIVVFDSEDNYKRNASNPKQDQWYRELRDLLDADPVWNDGEVIFSKETAL